MFSLFFRFLISPTGRNSEPIHTFNSSNDVFCFVHVPFGGLEPSNSLLGVSGPKNTNISTCFRTLPICSGNCFSIRALRSKLPLNVKITLQKLDFRLEVTNQEFLSHTGGSTGSVFSKMAAAAIFNFENRLPFLYYQINSHQI